MRKTLKLAATSATALSTAAAVILGTYVFLQWEPGADNTAVAAVAPQAMPVPVTKVLKTNLPIFLDYAGRTEPMRQVLLQAKLSGYVDEQRAADGADVKTGDLLYRIDNREFQAVLEQGQAQVKRDQSLLDYARINLDRGDDLSKKGVVAKDILDQRQSAVDQAEATLAMDRASLKTAQLNLEHTDIRAPFAGRLGKTLAVAGTYINNGASSLNTLVQLDPIYVTFNVSEADLVAVQAARKSGRVEAAVTLPGTQGAARKGDLTFIDNTVDQATGTITARVTLPNPDFALLPGQYVHIKLQVEEKPDALMIPQIALGSSQLGKYLYVVNKENTVDQRPVSLGAQSGDLVSVDGKISEGDLVVTGNLQKIGPGSLVQPMLAEK